MNTRNEKLKKIFQEYFMEDGRVPNWIRVMGFFPDFVELWNTTLNFIMKENGPLPYTWRNYIAILVLFFLFCIY